jgi:hypothetical protein
MQLAMWKASIAYMHLFVFHLPWPVHLCSEVCAVRQFNLYLCALALLFLGIKSLNFGTAFLHAVAVV